MGCYEMVPDIDLGSDHWLKFTQWAPDDLPENREYYRIPEGQPLPVVTKWGAIITHYRPDGTYCEGCIDFHGEWQWRVHQLACEGAKKEGKPEPPYIVWTVEKWEPLTCSPSLMCKAPLPDGGFCGDHGFIKDGKWVKA